jgi:hypothetical protein
MCRVTILLRQPSPHRPGSVEAIDADYEGMVGNEKVHSAFGEPQLVLTT